MAQLVVRNIEDSLKANLKRRARRHGHSMEEEVREILRDALKHEDRSAPGLGTRLRRRFADLGLTLEVTQFKGEPIRPARFK